MGDTERLGEGIDDASPDLEQFKDSIDTSIFYADVNEGNRLQEVGDYQLLYSPDGILMLDAFDSSDPMDMQTADIMLAYLEREGVLSPADRESLTVEDASAHTAEIYEMAERFGIDASAAHENLDSDLNLERNRDIFAGTVRVLIINELFRRTVTERVPR